MTMVEMFVSPVRGALRPGGNRFTVHPASVAKLSREPLPFIGVSMKLLLIQGANMEYLGRRQPELYGTVTAKELDALLRRRARALDVELEILYTNMEGEG